MPMLPTPSTSHVSFAHVYEPAEDSFLFLDTLSRSSEVTFLSERFNASICPAPLVLEVGPGSGVVLSFIASNSNHLIGRKDVLTMGIDVNEFACKATAETVKRNLAQASESQSSWSAAFVDCVTGDLTAALRKGSVDLLIFNPPYVPSETVPVLLSDDYQSAGGQSNREAEFARDSNLLAVATDGGIDGMQVTARLLEELKSALNPVRGVAYVLLCAQNQPETVKKTILDWGPQWSVETAGSSGKQGGWEKLQIIRICRSN